MSVNIKSDINWSTFYKLVFKGKIDYRDFLQKVIETEEFMWKIVKFGLQINIFPKWEDLFVKIVFWLQNERNLSKKIVEKFSNDLEKFISDYSRSIKKKVYYKEEEIFLEYLKDINCWCIEIKLDIEKKGNSFITPYHLYLGENIVFENIFNFFYDDFFWIKETKNIYIDKPTDKYWKHIKIIEAMDISWKKSFTYAPAWLTWELEKTVDWEEIDRITLEEIILNQPVKKDLGNLIKRFKFKEHFEKWNAKEARGILLYWPPWTWKTMIAKVLATELDYNFYTLSSVDIESMWFWQSTKNLKDFFNKIPPNSIIFMDELESLLPKRTWDEEIWWKKLHEVKRDIVATFLEYFDWMKSLKDVLFVWATNNIEMIDEAILRSGRFDIKLFIEAPDLESREKIWKLYLEKAQENVSYNIYDETVDIKYLAEITWFFSWADIKEMVRRVMNEYAYWSLELKAERFNPKTTFAWLENHIEKFKEETSIDKWIIPKKEELYLSDIWWQKELKEELKKIILQIKNKQLFNDFDLKMPKWLLLYWPPWTWKTMTAKVIANETWLLFYMLTAKDFIWEKWINSLDKKFDSFRSPSIVFIDEIDAIWTKREKLWSQYYISVLNLFLQKMDWFSSWEREIFFIWATNNYEILDEALIRAGRFDLKIKVDYPDFEARKEIFKIYIDKAITKKWQKIFSEKIDFDKLSKETEGFVWADIKELIRRLKQKLVMEIIEKKIELIWNEIWNSKILQEIELYKKEKFWNTKKIWFDI